MLEWTLTVIAPTSDTIELGKPISAAEYIVEAKMERLRRNGVHCLQVYRSADHAHYSRPGVQISACGRRIADAVGDAATRQHEDLFHR